MTRQEYPLKSFGCFNVRKIERSKLWTVPQVLLSAEPLLLELLLLIQPWQVSEFVSSMTWSLQQINECISMLKGQGAAQNLAVYDWSSSVPIKRRGRVQQAHVLLRRRDGTASQWQNRRIFLWLQKLFQCRKRCTRNKKFLEGSEALLIQIHAKTMMPEPELESHNFPF